MTLKPWIYIYLIYLTISTEIKKTCGQFEEDTHLNICNSDLHCWNGLNIYNPRPVSRFPYRMWEGKGQIRYLGRRNVELICDFQRPENVVSNVIWYKVGGPEQLFFNQDRGQLTRYQMRILIHPHKMYTLGRQGGSSLIIQDFNARDAGRYRCLASRYALTPFSANLQIFTVYKDIEFSPNFLNYV